MATKTTRKSARSTVEPARLVIVGDSVFDRDSIATLIPGYSGRTYYLTTKHGTCEAICDSEAQNAAVRAWIAAGMPTDPEGNPFSVTDWHRRQGIRT